MINVKYSKNGVFCDPYHIKKGNNIQLTYEGILANEGAQMVYAHIGYGSNERWVNTGEYEMVPNGSGKFEVELPITESGNLNAFKDDGGNWDNNGGQNYIFSPEEK